MKSNSIFKFLLIMACISLCFSVGSMKSESVLEFFNNLFSELGTAETSRLSNKNMNTNNMNEKVKNSRENDGETKEQIDQNQNDIASQAGSQDDDFQAWMRISSPDFKNKNKFPPLILQSGEEVIIKVDSNYFRINDAFDSSNTSPDMPKNPLDFWFRLKENNLYYSKTKTDYNILGSLTFAQIDKLDLPKKFCFKVTEASGDKWTLCTLDEETRKKIYCKIREIIGDNVYECSTAQKKAEVDLSTLPKPTIIEDKVIQPIILIPLPSKTCNQNWNYLNNGKDWECTCKEGVEQSPINLPEQSRAVLSPVTPLFKYEEVHAKSTVTTIDGELKAKEYIKIKYMKGALRIFHPNFGKIITLDGAIYVAEEIVFHTPSEHTIDGKRYDMEMQVIHYGQTKGDISKQVVLSFLFQKTPGVYNMFIDDVDFFSLPNPMYTEREITNNLFIPKVLYSSTSDEIPVLKPFSFYTYQGSLTFPPCTERTIHYVASEPIPIGSSAIQLMSEAIRHPDMKNEQTGEIVINIDDATNNRDTQPLGERAVFFFDHKKFCGPDFSAQVRRKKEVKPEGHYEKLKSKIVEYFYVGGNNPSGLPNSYVVSETEAKGSSSTDDPQ